jgi:fructose-1-phosphate kinase PfkB-like protein
MVSVRLSENEYQALVQLCSSSGARSVSDLTRSAMHALLRGTTPEEMLHIRISEFCEQMNSLGRRIEELVEKVAASERQN